MTDLAKKLVEAAIAGVVAVGALYMTGVVEPISLVAAFLTAAGAKLSAPQAVLK